MGETRYVITHYNHMQHSVNAIERAWYEPYRHMSTPERTLLFLTLHVSGCNLSQRLEPALNCQLIPRKSLVVL